MALSCSGREVALLVREARPSGQKCDGSALRGVLIPVVPTLYGCTPLVAEYRHFHAGRGTCLSASNMLPLCPCQKPLSK